MDTTDDCSGTPIPHPDERSPGDAAAPSRTRWSALSAAEKRVRVIDAAIAVFSEHGLEAPMQLLAERAGVGVASIYRLFGSKHDLFAAIVVRRHGELAAAFEAALAAPGERWSAFTGVLADHVAHQSPEPFTNEARALVEGRPEVDAALAATAAAQERLLDAARAEGRWPAQDPVRVPHDAAHDGRG